MGLSSSKQKTTNEPWAPAQPYILKGLEQSGQVFDQQQPGLNAAGAAEMATYNKLAPGAEQGIQGAQGVVNDTLAGKNLNGNPYLSGLIADTNRGVTDGVNSQFESSGRYGSGMHGEILAKELAKADNNLMFNNYAMERQNQIGAVGQAGNLMQGSQSLINNAAELPWIGVGALNGNVRQASNGYGTQTTTSSPNYGQMLMGAAAGGLNAYAYNPSAFSDPRLKTDVERVGTLPSGLGLYEWNYIADAPVAVPEGRYRGVMADEVALIAPELLGPPLGGYMTVHYTPERIG